MVKAIDAARYLVYLSHVKKDNTITPLKLQKLLYLAQGWNYVWENQPAFDGRFKAWEYGPVNIEVYHAFKKYGRSIIPEQEGISFLDDPDVQSTLDAVWMGYGEMSTSKLVSLTHSQRPWKEAYKEKSFISNDSIKEYFKSTY